MLQKQKLKVMSKNSKEGLFILILLELEKKVKAMGNKMGNKMDNKKKNSNNKKLNNYYLHMKNYSDSIRVVFLLWENIM